MKYLVLLLALTLSLPACAQETLKCSSGAILTCPAPEPGPGTTSPTQPPSTVQPITNGVTVDAPWGTSQINNIVASLVAFGRPMTTRIVYDEFVAATEYTASTKKIHGVSFVVGEILDSFYMGKYSVATLNARTTEYINALKSDVDVWEFGNESNGEWTGTIANVVAKINGSYGILKAAGKKTMLTLTLCTEKAANKWDAWSANLTPEMRAGIDYVTISYYEQDCSSVKPNFQQIFDKLGTLYPNAWLAMGEVGLENGTVAQKTALINKYYRDMKITHPHYIPFYAWWYFQSDMVPSSKSLHGVLKAAMH